MTGAGPETVHGSTVALGSSAVLVLGPSGAGKSALALHLMALGCTLVSDDHTALSLRDGAVIARAPEAIRGRIEARGMGLLVADTVAEAVLRLVVDLGIEEPDRLPPDRRVTLAGCDLPVVWGKGNPHLPAQIVQYLKGGRCA